MARIVVADSTTACVDYGYVVFIGITWGEPGETW